MTQAVRDLEGETASAARTSRTHKVVKLSQLTNTVAPLQLAAFQAPTRGHTANYLPGLGMWHATFEAKRSMQRHSLQTHADTPGRQTCASTRQQRQACANTCSHNTLHIHCSHATNGTSRQGGSQTEQAARQSRQAGTHAGALAFAGTRISSWQLRSILHSLPNSLGCVLSLGRSLVTWQRNGSWQLCVISIHPGVPSLQSLRLPVKKTMPAKS